LDPWFQSFLFVPFLPYGLFLPLDRLDHNDPLDLAFLSGLFYLADLLNLEDLLDLAFLSDL
jgi:hypothetical protein